MLTIAGLAPEFGGPSHSVPALATALVEAGAEVELMACESARGQGAPRLPQPPVNTRLLGHRNRSARGWLPAMNQFPGALRHACAGQREVVAQDNGVWLPTNHAVAQAARKLGRPLVISPRGMLSAWAMEFRGFKKRLAWWLYQRRDLEGAQVLHATSRAEANEFRQLSLTRPIAIVPNGVELCPTRNVESGSRNSGRRTILFLSRIHPKKGLRDLISAWARVRPTGWRVVLAGDDAEGHRAGLELQIRQQRVEPDFEFVGPVEGEAKWNWFRQADLFVLPSHSENFGIVVAEALGCGVPVITTRGTPWDELVTHRCGWWTEIGGEPLATALREALAISDEARREMGARGRQLVESKYTWGAAAQQMLSVYRWLLGTGGPPACVSAGLEAPASRLARD